MRIYKIILATSQLDILGNKLSKNIFDYITNNYFSLKNKPKTELQFPSGIIIKEDNGKDTSIPIFFQLIIFERKSQDYVVIVSSHIGEDRRSIYIYVKLNRLYFYNLWFKKLYDKIYKAVRHEINHMGANKR